MERKFKNPHEKNKEIEAFLKQKQADKAPFSQAEIDFINQYEGAGGQAKHGAEASEGLLYEFYTPLWICELMWELAMYHGYDGGNVLEPSCATGRLFQHAPDKSKCVGFEINEITAQIAKINYPQTKIHKGYFETAFLEENARSLMKKGLTWLKEYPFSLVIGNPPYGIYKNLYSSYFSKEKFLKQIEIFFIYKGLQMLKKGGLLIYLQSSNFLRNGTNYNDAKDKIGEIATFVDAYRLPKVFSNSDVPTDIMVLRRK